MLILAPAFEMAGNYVLLGVVINNLGQQYSKLAPRTYVWLFLSGDVISLCIQGGGGGVAASALTLADANTGGYIMAGGTIFQLVIMSCFTCLFVDFTIHYLKDQPNKQIHPFSWLSWRRSGNQANSPTSTRTAVEELKLDAPTKKHAKLILLGIAISTSFVFVRSVYRCPELLKGWNGTRAIAESTPSSHCLTPPSPFPFFRSHHQGPDPLRHNGRSDDRASPHLLPPR